MNIEGSIKDWVEQEVKIAKLNGLEPKELRSGIRIAIKVLEKIAIEKLEELQKSTKVKPNE